MGARDVETYSDLRLVVNQVQGSFEACDSQMKKYLQMVKQVMVKFCTAKVFQVARGQKRYADSLATLASVMTEDVPRMIKVELITERSINIVTDVIIVGISVTAVSMVGPSWMDPIVDFLVEDHILNDEKEANKVRRVASCYWLSLDRKLYLRSFGGPYLLCLHLGKVNKVLIELHEGVCNSHVGGCFIAHRVMTQGFWWPWMQKDVAEYVHRCEQFQKHASLTHQPTGYLNPISRPWPFAQWGLDILGPFPRATGN